MKTLNKGKHKLLSKFLLTIAIAITFSLVAPIVVANTAFEEWYFSVLSKFKLQPKQLDNFVLVKQHATLSGHPELIQALMMQESTGGLNLKSNGNCHGALQIMTTTAIGILKGDPQLREMYFSDRPMNKHTVADLLKKDVVFSIMVADRIVADGIQKSKSIDRTILSYNMGIKYLTHGGSPANYKYVREVKNKMKMTSAINSLIAPSEKEDIGTSSNETI